MTRARLALTIISLLACAPAATAAESRPAQLFTAALEAEGAYTRGLSGGPGGETRQSSGTTRWNARFLVAVPALAAGERLPFAGEVGAAHEVTTTGVFDGPDPDAIANEPFECKNLKSYAESFHPLAVTGDPAGIAVSWGGLTTLYGSTFFDSGQCTPLEAFPRGDFSVARSGLEPATSVGFTLPAAAFDANVVRRDLAQPTSLPATCAVDGFAGCSQGLAWTGTLTFSKYCRNGAGFLRSEAPGPGEGIFDCVSRCDEGNCDASFIEPRAASEVRVGPRGAFRVAVACFGGPCEGGLAVRAFRRLGPVARRKFVLARRPISLEPGDVGELRLRLGRRARRLLPARSELNASAVLRLEGADVVARRTPFEFLLRGPRRYRR